jgi:hypothetical protein
MVPGSTVPPAGLAYSGVLGAAGATRCRVNRFVAERYRNCQGSNFNPYGTKQTLKWLKEKGVAAKRLVFCAAQRS